MMSKTATTAAAIGAVGQFAGRVGCVLTELRAHEEGRASRETTLRTEIGAGGIIGLQVRWVGLIVAGHTQLDAE
jgi:hypothetical protein